MQNTQYDDDVNTVAIQYADIYLLSLEMNNDNLKRCICQRLCTS